MSSVSSTSFPVITTLDRQVLVPGEFTLARGGHRTAQECIIYEGPGAYWLPKGTQVVQEYLGSTAFRLLGLSVPQFKMGILQKDATSKRQIVFLQEFLVDAEPMGNTWRALPSAVKVHLLCAGQLVGDANFLGPRNDNIIHVPPENDSKEVVYPRPGAPLKIDCARAFSELAAPGFVANELKTLIQDYNEEDRESARTFISGLSADTIREGLVAAYRELMQGVGQTDLDPESIRVLDLDNMGLSRIKTIQALCDALCAELATVQASLAETAAAGL
jgi:hypothetical protein